MRPCSCHHDSIAGPLALQLSAPELPGLSGNELCRRLPPKGPFYFESECVWSPVALPLCQPHISRTGKESSHFVTTCSVSSLSRGNSGREPTP